MNETRNTKVILIGETGVGKSSIIQRFLSNKFETGQMPTIGIDYSSIKVDFQGRKNHLQIWDTAGQERFRSLVKSYYSNIQVAVIVYSVASLESFERVDYWLQNLKENVDQNVLIILVGNKRDLIEERVVTEE